MNTRTRLRDQERSPIAADLKRAMREKATLGVRTFALTADVKKAHRQVPIHPRDWHLLGCRVETGAEYFWCSVSVLLLVSRVVSSRHTVSIPRRRQRPHVAYGGGDDYQLEAGGEHDRFALFAFFLLCCTCGVPLSWNKTASGETVVWVGFELLHSTHHLGISQRRAEWFTKWAREVANSDQVHIGRFEESLGRIMFVVGALELERPFLGPLCRFMSLHPRSSVRRVPPYVRFSSAIWQNGSRAPGTTTAQSRWKEQRWHHVQTRRQAARGRGSEAGSHKKDRTARSMSEEREGFRSN